MQDHNWPQYNSLKGSGYGDPREKDCCPDVEAQKGSHPLARSREIRGQTRDAQPDQRNPGKSCPDAADPFRCCPEDELRLDIWHGQKADADKDFYPGRQLNGSSMPGCFFTLPRTQAQTGIAWLGREGLRGNRCLIQIGHKSSPDAESKSLWRYDVFIFRVPVSIFDLSLLNQMLDQ